MAKKIYEFYGKLLTTAGLAAQENGNITPVDDKHSPIVIELDGVDKTLVMPTEDVLKANQWDKLVAFHPLSENILNGESEVIYVFRQELMYQYNDKFKDIMTAIINAANGTTTKKLTKKQMAFLAKFPGLSEQFVGRLAKAVAKIDLDKFPAVVSYIKQGAELDGKRYRKACIFYVNMRVEDKKLFKIALNKEEVACFSELINEIFPDYEGTGFSSGTEHTVAPILNALLETHRKVAERLNELIGIWKSHLPCDIEPFNMDYMEHLGEFKKLGAQIPPLPGNTGTVNVKKKDEEVSDVKRPQHQIEQAPAQQQAQQAPQQQPAPVQQAPVQQTPAPATNTGERTWASPAMQQPQQQPMQEPNPYPHYQQPHQQQHYQQPQPQQHYQQNSGRAASNMHQQQQQYQQPYQHQQPPHYQQPPNHQQYYQHHQQYHQPVNTGRAASNMHQQHYQHNPHQPVYQRN